jgi:hypothetical protein
MSATEGDTGWLARLDPFRALRETGIGKARYTLRAWLLATLPSLLLFIALIAAGEATLRPRAGMPDRGTVIASLLLAPILETALMLPFAWLLARVVPQREGLQVFVLATIAALAHGPGGNWRQVFNALWPFAIFAATLLAWRRHSWREAFLLTAAVHALYNAVFLTVGALGVLVAGR